MTKIIQEVLTTSQAAEYLQTSKQTLLKVTKERKLKANRIGRGYRFLKEELEKYLRGEVDED